MKKISIRIFFLFIFLCISISPAFSATWDGGALPDDELASSGKNWTTNSLPPHGDRIFFNATSSKDCTWDLDATYSVLTIEGAYTGTITLGSPGSAITLLNGLVVPDTGQTNCYDSAGNPLGSCGATGQDGAYALNHMSFTDNGDGTVMDNVTGLEWQKCTNGRSGADCATGSATFSDWATAGTTCANLDLSGTGWRLPEDFELVDIADYGRSNPALDTTIFPNTSASIYWTANSWSGDAVSANVILFYSGLITTIAKSDPTIFTRCVRGTLAADAKVFTDNGDGTVTDNATGLVWHKCSYGQNNDADCTGLATQRTWDQALSDCEGSSLLGYTSWRLPNIKELNSISDTALSPATNSTFFPNSPPASWWSSTTAVTTTYALGVSFGFGGLTVNLNKTPGIGSYVRCVR